MPELTSKQEAILKFIELAIKAGNPPPTYREIAEHFSFKSKTAAVDHVRALIVKGFLIAVHGEARSFRLAERSAPRGTVFSIPMLESIPAGKKADWMVEGHECIHVTEDALAFKPTPRTFVRIIKGDSMTGRGILDGDIGVFEHGMEARPGKIVAALVDGGCTLKTFMVKDGKPYLKAENPKYSDIYPVEELMIEGVLVAILRRYKTP